MLSWIDFIKSFCDITDKEILKSLDNIQIFDSDSGCIRVNNF